MKGTEVMYPSGVWRGYWEQAGWGRQPMGELVLRFVDGQIFGDGTDVIGPFSFSGEYDERGRIRMTKQYHRRHRVFYEGTYDGEGTLYGRWSIPPVWSGPFALSPVAAAPPSDAPIEDLQ
jgi:hypothetical protein